MDNRTSNEPALDLEALIGPLVAQFEAETGIDAEVRYGGTAELATLLLEEGANSPADLFTTFPPSQCSKSIFAV